MPSRQPARFACRAKANSRASTCTSTACWRIPSTSFTDMTRRRAPERARAWPRWPRHKPNLFAPAEGENEHPMHMIKTIIRPNKVDEVRAALTRLNVSGMTVTEVRGHGKQKGHTAVYRGKEYDVSLLPKMQIETVVADAIAEDAIRAIVEAARTGEIGDGRVFVLPVERSYKIRTGELDV